MMERLFTLHAQETAFLALLLGGVGLAALLHVLAWVRRRWHALAIPADALAALALLALLLWAVVGLEAALRLHSLLGLTLGMALCEAGLMPLGRQVVALGKRIQQKSEKKKEMVAIKRNK